MAQSQTLYEDDLDVPRSITVKHGCDLDGGGRSWTFPVYLLQSDLADQWLGDEDPLPPDNGNPHPFLGPIQPREPEWIQHWADDQMFGPLANQWHPPHQPHPHDHDQHDGEQPEDEVEPIRDDEFEAMAEVHEDDDPQDSMEVSGVSSKSSMESYAEQSRRYPARLVPPVASLPSGSPGAASGSQTPGLQSVPPLALAVPSPFPQLVLDNPLEQDNPLADQDAPAPPGCANLPVRFVYARRRRGGASRASSSRSLSKPPSPLSVQGLRQSARIKARYRGFKPLSRWDQGQFLSTLPTIEEYIELSRSDAPCPPLSLQQIQHSTVFLCGINADKVSNSSLHSSYSEDSAAPFASAEAGPSAASPAVDLPALAPTQQDDQHSNV
ncbi:hypothetical protein GUJ93_ZPchr0008g12542 [Zizania palustris]|uniref:Uncharacterized protein n=1 Tax=Zizania palustris TaxID=103762 RepID=A0A8J5RA99_ZIZPA|nr:hypothetical protein GUJ93_ZPchr0008g12542 [Zizania palustris]